ncbi:hypothetical protein PM082_005259 [Marasmius tenuissimus]|nr:hypothetical protein PM082_005259 [Marasmius tenuissimus]
MFNEYLHSKKGKNKKEGSSSWQISRGVISNEAHSIFSLMHMCTRVTTRAPRATLIDRNFDPVNRHDAFVVITYIVRGANVLGKSVPEEKPSSRHEGIDWTVTKNHTVLACLPQIWRTTRVPSSEIKPAESARAYDALERIATSSGGLRRSCNLRVNE